MSGHALLELDRFLPYRLSVLSNTISSAIARSYQSRFRLSITEWRVLAVLGRYPGLSASEVVERTAMDKVAVSRAVNSLLDAGRVERSVDEDDRRRAMLRLTSVGRAIYDEVAPAALAYERALLSSLSPEEQVQLDRLLGKLERNHALAAVQLGTAEDVPA